MAGLKIRFGIPNTGSTIPDHVQWVSIVGSCILLNSGISLGVFVQGCWAPRGVAINRIVRS